MWPFRRVRLLNGLLSPYCQIPHFHYTSETMNIENLSPSQLRKAADLKEQVEALEQELAGLTSFDSGNGVPAPVKAKRGRPAKAKPAVGTEPGKQGPKKGGMSAAGRARIAAAQRARWAKVRAAKKV
jgi:hypothetical protein